MRKLKLMKTLLVAAGLAVGASNAWAITETVYSWDFTVYASTTDITTTSETTLTENRTTCNLATAPTACEGLYFNDTWKCVRSGDTNPGLRNYSNGDRMVIIPGLKSGDVITITGNTDAINHINTTKYTGTPNDANTTLTFTMEADGNFYFKMVKGGATVNDVKVYPTIRTIVVTRELPIVEVASWNFETASWAKETGFGSSTVTINSQSCTYATGDLEGLALQGGSGTNWTVNSSGLTQGNGNRNIAILNLKAGDEIKIETAATISDLVNGTSTNDTYTGTCKFSVTANGAFGFLTDRNKYTTTISVYRARSVVVDEYNEVKAIAEALLAVPNDNASATSNLSSTLTTQNGVVSSATTASAIYTAKSTLQTAIASFIAAANPLTGNRFDLTYLLTNPNIENITDWDDAAAQGWYTDIPRTDLGQYNNFAARTNLNSSKNGIERYTSNACTTANTYALYQKVTLPTGNYSFNAYALANAATSIVMAAGDTEGDAVTDENFTEYGVDFIQDSESEIKVGLKISSKVSNTCNWTAITGLKLYKEASSYVPATVGLNGYTTFASPYALDLTDANRPEGLKAYKATLTGATLSFEKLNQTVPAGTGLLLLGETNGGTYNIPVVASGDAVTTALTGVTADTPLQSVADDTYYFVMKKAANAESALEFAPLSTSAAVTIPAGKAYVTVPNSAFNSTARSITITFDDASGINNVTVSPSMMGDGKVYNLNGQRVTAPTKGLYIINGRKVAVK